MADRLPSGLSFTENCSTLIVVGSGGVGKTTVAAAFGYLAADRPNKRVLVLTVDPARRLASAFGLGDTDGAARRLDAGLRGELWIEMLDAQQEWDLLIRTHAPDEVVRDSVLTSPLYQNVTRRFVHSHEYAAMERLHCLQASGEWDLIVVDTPPSRNALDFLDAPARMRDFFGGRLLRWLTAPANSRLALQAFRPFRLVADRILGGPFVRDLTDFFALIKTMEKGFVEHANEVEESLTDESTGFVVVTTPARGPVGEATNVIEELVRRRCRIQGVVVNRATPKFDECSVDAAAQVLAARDRSVVERVVAVMNQTVRQMNATAAAEKSIVEGLTDGIPKVVVPMLDVDVHDVEGVGRIAAYLAAGSPAVS